MKRKRFLHGSASAQAKFKKRKNKQRGGGELQFKIQEKG